MDNFKLATSFVLQSYLPAEKGLMVAAENGFDSWYVDGSISSDFVDKWDDTRISTLCGLISNLKIKPIFHSNYKVPLASDVEYLRECAVKYIKKEIELAAKLSAPIIIHGGAVVEPRGISKVKSIALESLITSLIELKRYAASLQVTLWLENLSNYPNHRPFTYIATDRDEFSKILNEIDIEIFFDFGHANVNATEPVISFFNLFHKQVRGISLSNNDGKIDQHLKLSDGSIDYLGVIENLIELGWEGIVGFETRNVKPAESLRKFQSISERAHSNKKSNFILL